MKQYGYSDTKNETKIMEYRMLERDYLSINKALCALFLALILNLNAVNIVFLTYRTACTYLIFGLFIFFAIIGNNRLFHFRINRPITLVLLLYLLWSFVTMEFHNTGAEEQYVKFILCLVVAYVVATLDRESQIMAIDISIFISMLFSIYTILEHDSIYRNVFYKNTGNRLTVTLPIALGLMFSLVKILVNRDSKLRIIFYFISALVQTIALLSFSARGNLLFPYAIFIIMLMINSINNRRAIIRSAILLAIGGSIFSFLFNRFASTEMINRMTRLFTQTDTEPRVAVYTVYINDMTDNLRLLIGSGFGRSANILRSAGVVANYPHNLFLELIGEGGLIGIALVVVMIIQVGKSEKRFVSRLNKIKWNMGEKVAQDFFLINGGLLFYLFSYFKSYSIYDGYQLFIFIAMILTSPFIRHENDSKYDF